MWVEPFCRCVLPFHHFHHFLLDRPPVILPQSHLPTLPLSHCSNTFPPSTGQTKNKFPLLLIFGNIFTERKNANTYLSLPYAKLVRNCPHPPKKENNILSHTHCVRFHMCRVCVWDVWLYDPLSQACPKLSLPAYCVLSTVSFHLNWPLQIQNSLQASQSHPSYLAFASLFFCWWFKCVGFPVPRHCPGEECSWT